MSDWKKPVQDIGDHGEVLSKERSRSLLTASLGHVIWGCSYLFTRIGLQDAAPDILLSLRFVLAFLLMNLLILLKWGKISLRGKDWKPLFFLAVSEPLYFYFESYGILYTNATFSGVILAVVPVVSILLAALFLKEYPSRKQVLFCILPVIGVIMIVQAGSSLGIIRPVGVVFLLGACLTSAAYKTANRKSAEQYTAFERTYVVLLVCSVVFTAAAFRTTGGGFQAWLEPLTHVKTAFAVIMLSGLCSVGANSLVNYAASNLPVIKISTLGLLTTVVSMAVGVLFLREPVSLLSGIGALLVLIGIWQVTRQGKYVMRDCTEVNTDASFEANADHHL